MSEILMAVQGVVVASAGAAVLLIVHSLRRAERMRATASDHKT